MHAAPLYDYYSLTAFQSAVNSSFSNWLTALRTPSIAVAPMSSWALAPSMRVIKRMSLSS
jgi:hypothetical protein